MSLPISTHKGYVETDYTVGIVGYMSLPTSVHAPQSNGDMQPKLDLSAVAFRTM